MEHPFRFTEVVTGIKPSATLAINQKSKELLEAGKTIYRFGLGQSPFPVPNLVTAALRENAHQKDYLNTKGLQELREAVAQYHLRKDGLEFKAENIQIGPGSKELIYGVMLALDATLILANPSWVSYEPQARLSTKTIQWIDTDIEQKWKISTEQLDAYTATISGSKMMLLNYPNNPSGQTYTEQELQAIDHIARKHNITIISDEIYGALAYEKHCSIAAYYREGTIVTAGLSKWCGAGGWCLGTAAFPDELGKLANYMGIIASETYTAVAAPIQYAAVEAFRESPSIKDYLIKSKAILKSVSNYCENILKESRLDFHSSEGGFYLFIVAEAYREELEKRNIKDGKDLVNALLEETGIAVLPGSDFGREETELSFRLAYVDFDGKQALEQYETFPDKSEFIRKCCPAIFEGMKILRNFFHTP